MSRSRRRAVRGSGARRAARKARSARLQSGALIAEPTLQDGELVTQREDLDVLVVVVHRDQPQGGEGVSDGDAGQSKEHGH
ncbi:hypothetical protein [Streptomyces sp. NPDC047525]|uniref:hypothetical protein n=1 Tax=Streptomyces sp. NPDC047525 TaxID=3155264 RepID=UPI0033F36EEC